MAFAAFATLASDVLSAGLSANPAGKSLVDNSPASASCTSPALLDAVAVDDIAAIAVRLVSAPMRRMRSRMPIEPIYGSSRPYLSP